MKSVNRYYVIAAALCLFGLNPEINAQRPDPKVARMAHRDAFMQKYNNHMEYPLEPCHQHTGFNPGS